MSRCPDARFRRGQIRGVQRIIEALRDFMARQPAIGSVKVDWHDAALDCIEKLNRDVLPTVTDEGLRSVVCEGGRYVPETTPNGCVRPFAWWHWEDCECSRTK